MSNPETTNMVKEPARTKMVAAPKKVKLTIQRDTQLRSGQVAQPGAVVEVDEDEAKEILAFCIDGNYDFAGERDGVQPKQKLRKAILYREMDAA